MAKEMLLEEDRTVPKINYVYKPLTDKDKVLKTVEVGEDQPFPGDVGILTSESWVVVSHSWAKDSDYDLGYYYSLNSGTADGSNICDVVYAASGSASGTFSASYARWRYFENIITSTYSDAWNFVKDSAGNSRKEALIFLYNRDYTGDRIRNDLNSMKVDFKSSGSSDEMTCGRYYVTSQANAYYGAVGFYEYGSYSDSFGETSTQGGRAYRDVAWLVCAPDILFSSSNANCGTTFLSSQLANKQDMFDFLNSGSLISGSSYIGLKEIGLKNEIHYKENTYFCRLYNDEYNYTTNDSARKQALPGTTADEANEYLDYIIDNPFAMITSLGLYNENYELVAVARLSSPIKKDFGEELLLKVKLRY